MMSTTMMSTTMATEVTLYDSGRVLTAYTMDSRDYKHCTQRAFDVYLEDNPRKHTFATRKEVVFPDAS